MKTLVEVDGVMLMQPSKVSVPRIHITHKELTNWWNIWVQDKSLQQRQRFGQYVVSRFPVLWKECYLAGTEDAYNMLLKETKEYREGLLSQGV